MQGGKVKVNVTSHIPINTDTKTMICTWHAFNYLFILLPRQLNHLLLFVSGRDCLLAWLAYFPTNTVPHTDDFHGLKSRIISQM